MSLSAVEILQSAARQGLATISIGSLATTYRVDELELVQAARQLRLPVYNRAGLWVQFSSAGKPKARHDKLPSPGHHEAPYHNSSRPRRGVGQRDYL